MNSTPASELGRAGQLVAAKYRLDAVIGRGGMGTVWRATHVSLGHGLALKLIAREFVRSPEALRRFDAEAKAAARLQSRHVVQVFDNGTLDDGTPFIAMELLEGENVSERIERAGAMGLADTVEILAQCCKALGRAHAAGIVHRDIKPDNIFLAREPDEDADVAKILDFGVAKMALGPDNASQVTGTGALLGTPLYMSPEQIRGARDVDQRADLYALGLVAYTMLTGALAISGDSFGDILIKICTQPLPSLCATAPWLPYAMEGWFQKACAREPADRWQSAQELMETLRVAAGGGPARASALPGSPLALPSASGRLAAVAPDFGQSAAVAATLAAPTGNTRPGMAPVALPVAPSVAPPVALAQAAVTAGRGMAAPPALSQSAAAVSVTAAGIPRRPIGAMVAAAFLGGLVVLGGAVLFVVSAHHPGSGAATDPSAIAPPASPSVSTTASAPTLATVIPAVALEDAAAPAASGPAAKPREPETVPAPHVFAPPVAAANPPAMAPTGHIPPVAPPHAPPARPAVPQGPIVVGY